jgi:hypothetical protein
MTSRSIAQGHLLAATALALALMSYFVLVVHEATQRGQRARLEMRQAVAAPARSGPASPTSPHEPPSPAQPQRSQTLARR